MIDPTLRREFQALSLKAVAGSGAVEWTVDGWPLGRSSDPVEWSLVPGTHRIAARDARGRTAEVTITVR
jgi:membrane carboxypeptidase/penicillin-binding protein PbpC